MQDGLVPFHCPGCQAVLNVAPGTQVRCGACQTVFFAATKPPPLPPPPAPAPPAPPPPPAAPPLAAPPLAAPPLAETAADDEAYDDEAEWQDERPRRSAPRWLFGVALYGFILVLVVAGGVLAWYVLQVQHQPIVADSKPPPVVERIVEVVPAPVAQAPPHWSDADRVSLRSDRIKVRVDRVEYGEVRGKDANRTVIISDAANYLQVFLNVKNHAPHECEYVSWYGNAFGQADDPQVARLTDNQDRAYQIMTFTDVVAIRGHTPRAVLGALEEADDVVIFEIPSEVDWSTIEYFHLELPALAFGNTGSYRFRIPRSMIQTL